jgi:protein-tyrosine phosphatase
MIDLHCHILPAMDDGPETLREAIEMCRMAAEDGITTVVATPHYSPGGIEWTGEEINRRIAELDAALRKEGISLSILPGADVAIFPELPSHPGRSNFLSLNSTRFMLVEFPFDTAPPGWDAFLRSLAAAGTTPVITHPERNNWFVRHPQALYTAVKQGALVQITAMSLLGGFGEEARGFSSYLLTHDLAHVIATDAHSIDERPPLLSEAVRVAASLINEERAGELVNAIPAAILAGKPIRTREPKEQEPKRETVFASLFRFMSRAAH